MRQLTQLLHFHWFRDTVAREGPNGPSLVLRRCRCGNEYAVCRQANGDEFTMDAWSLFKWFPSGESAR